MVEDLEVGVLLKPDTSELEDVEDREIGGGGGAVTGGPGGRQQQRRTIASGVSRGLLAAGIFGGILSQLQSVGALISSVLGILSRALLPTIEVIADLIRPLLSSLNDFIASPQKFISDQTGIPIKTLFELPIPETEGGEDFEFSAGLGTQGNLGQALGGAIDLQVQAFESITGKPDQSDEGRKIDLLEDLQSAIEEGLGGF